MAVSRSAEKRRAARKIARRARMLAAYRERPDVKARMAARAAEAAEDAELDLESIGVFTARSYQTNLPLKFFGK